MLPFNCQSLFWKDGFSPTWVLTLERDCWWLTQPNGKVLYAIL